MRDDVFFEAQVSIPAQENESIVPADLEARGTEIESEVSIAEQLPIFEVLSDGNYKKLNSIEVVTAGFFDPEAAETQEIYTSTDSEDPVAEPVPRFHGISVGA